MILGDIRVINDPIVNPNFEQSTQKIPKKFFIILFFFMITAPKTKNGKEKVIV
jgi:hypothetical protein